MTTPVRAASQPAERLEAFFRAGFAFVQDHHSQARAIFNTLNGPDEAFKMRLYQAYQPLFQLLDEEILRPGVAQGDFRQVEEGVTVGLLMMIYLGTGSQLSPEGQFWLGPDQVANFVLHALRCAQAGR